MKLLIQNGKGPGPGDAKTVTLTDLLAENGRVALLERGLETEADRIIDACGAGGEPGPGGHARTPAGPGVHL